ncbi:MAG: histidine phosphatase family protein [Solirubrobacteraceae bacterium]|jgi:probable phosphoglycerate mutase
MAGQLVVVRHADTDWTVSGRHTSRTDIALNATGRADAAALAARLAGRSFVAVWCSPLARAVQTCAIAGFGDRALERAELREWSYGAYEGMTTEQIHAAAPGWELFRDGCPDGEDAAAVGGRCDAVLASLPADGDVLAFAHGHLLRVMIARWLALAPAAGALFELAPAGIGVLGYERERRVLRSLG